MPVRSPGEGNGYPLQYTSGFPGGSDGKESARNVGDLGSIPGSGRSPGEGCATHSSILAWRIPGSSPWGCKKSDTREWLMLYFFQSELGTVHYLTEHNSLETMGV